VRDATGRVLRIVEQKDASPEERAIREVNTGFLVADRARLPGWLVAHRQRQRPGRVLPDRRHRPRRGDGVEVAVAQPATIEEVAGVNDRVQLAALERYYQRRQART
jgi:bifunctional UDP-N-acetylglucosamine pyrophosphorylase / glucosamine-1-phosphate N-acetyltransferase